MNGNSRPLFQMQIYLFRYTVCILFFVDKVGSYVAELKVTDSFDASSENFAATVIEVVPYEDLFITLSWDTPNIDLDLHLLSNPMGITVMRTVLKSYLTGRTQQSLR